MADRSVRVRLIADVQQYSAAMRQAGQTTVDFGRQVTNGSSASRDVLSSVGRTAGLMGAGMAAGLGLAINATMGFDRQLSELGAVSSATAQEMDAYRQAALDAGAATAFSASEAALAQTELAKAGVSTADILGGGLTGALSLAAAGGLELGRAAEVAASAMTIFGLSGGDVTHIADVLAAGANKSATDVDELAMAMSQSGLVADQLGLTLEDTVGVLSMFAQSGLRGSDAGTSFKTMLQRLTPQSVEARNEMARLGLDFFDAQGQFIGISGAAQELQDALGNLTEEQRATSLGILFGSDAVRAATILYEGGAAGVTDWTGAVDDAGFAADVAAKRMDNLAGDVEALRGSIETAFIEGGSQATGALRFMTQGATDAVNAFNEAPPALQGFIVGVGGITSAGLLAVGAIGSIVPKVQEFRTALVGIGPAGVGANNVLGTLGKAGAYAGGVAALAAAMVPLHAALEQAFQEDAPNLDRMGLALVNFGRDSTIAGELADAFGSDLSGLSDDLSLLEDRRSGFHLDLAEDFDEAVHRIDSVDKALAQLVSTGHRAAAEEVFADLTANMSPEEVERLVGELGDYRDALAASDTQQALAASGATGLGDSMGETAVDVEEVTKQLDEYIDTLKAAVDPFFAMLDALNSNAEAQAALSAAQQEGTATGAELVALHEAVAQSALGVEEASLRLATAVETGTVSVEDARATLQRWVDQGRISQETADIMAYSFGGAATEANRLAGDRTINFTANTGAALTAINYLGQRIADVVRAQSYTFSGSLSRTGLNGGASGGFVGQTTAGPTDTIPYLVAPGEYIVNAGAAQAVGPEVLGAVNAGLIPAMPVPVGVGAPGGMVTVELVVTGGQNDLVRLVQKWVRVNAGGDVQVALGQGAAA